MILPFLADPLFRGFPGPGLTGSQGLTDITFAGQRHVMPLRTSVAKATGSAGISQREEREMGLFSKLLGDSAAVARYKAADDDLARVANRDRGESDAWHDANDAMWDAREDVPWWRR
jgi:hypothetical protein